MGVITTKEGVLFAKIAPAGFRILSALDQIAQELFLDLVITSATDGVHSGPADPHHTGEAFDVRSQGMNEDTKQKVVIAVMDKLGWEHFYGFLEDAGKLNEHFHFQRRRDTVYP